MKIENNYFYLVLGVVLLGVAKNRTYHLSQLLLTRDHNILIHRYFKKQMMSVFYIDFYKTQPTSIPGIYVFIFLTFFLSKRRRIRHLR